MAVEITNAAQAVGRITIIEMAAQGVTGVGWISDHRAGAYPLDDLHQQTFLRIDRVQFDPLGHGSLVCSVSANCTRHADVGPGRTRVRSEEHTSELQSLMRNSYAVFCLKKKNHH